MASITDNLKDGLKYPLYDPIKIVILAILYFIVMLLSAGSVYILFNSLKKIIAPVVNTTVNTTVVNTTANATVNTATITSTNSILGANLYNLVPVTSMVEIVILLIISIIISIFITGYLYKIIKSTIEDNNVLPKFNDIPDIFICGIKVAVVTIVYSIIPSILLSVGLYLISNNALATIGGIVLVIAIVLGIILGLMLIMALNNMAANDDSLTSAFDFKGVFALISAIGWVRFIGSIIFLIVVGIIIIFAAVIISVIITLILSLAGAIGTSIGICIMLIITILVASYLEIVTSRFYGSLYKEAIKE